MEEVRSQYPRARGFEKRKPLVLYHGGCKDGFCAAWVAHQALGGECELVPAMYGEGAPPLDIAGRDVYILDFSYPKKILIQMIGACKKLVLLDHHKTAETDLKDLVIFQEANPLGHHIQFDMNRSGAGMTWDYFNGGVQRPWLVDYVEDRDIWKWALPSSREVNAFISTLRYKLEDWNYASELSLGKVTEYGAVLLNKIDQYNDSLIEALTQRIPFDIYVDIPCINAPHEGISELMEEMLKRFAAPFCIGWRIGKDGRVSISLRSVGDFDVSEIAKKVGGGGHRNAAGCELREMKAMEFLSRVTR